MRPSALPKERGRQIGQNTNASCLFDRQAYYYQRIGLLFCFFKNLSEPESLISKPEGGQGLKLVDSEHNVHCRAGAGNKPTAGSGCRLPARIS